jgi:large subunit ribosomal protein L10
MKGGWFDGEVLDGEAVKKVADLPSKEELQARLLATVLEPPQQVLRLLQAPGRDLVTLLHNYAHKLEDSGGA